MLGLLLGVALLGVALARQTSTVSIPHVGPESGHVQANVTYCTAGGLDLKMDLYLPALPDARPAPVAVYIHGGGWQEGDKNWIDRILPADRLVARGYVVAAPNYRLAPWSQWPAQIEDVKCAVRYLRAHATTYHLDPARIGVWGESAGGHLAAMLGLAGPDAGFEGTGGWADQSSAVQAVVDMCGPTDFTDLDLNLPTRIQAQLLLGRQPDTALLRRISPISYARRDAPPFLIFQGDKDTLVAPRNSQRLQAALLAAGATSTLVMVKNSEHVFAPAGGPTQPSVPEIDDQAVAFFDRYLQPMPLSFRTFPQTGKTVGGAFLTYWEAHGGVAALGYPVSEALAPPAGDGVPVGQYFERALLEYHPGASPAGEVVPAPLGARAYAARYPGGAPDQQPSPDPAAQRFPATGRRLGGIFLAYWQTHAGPDILGDPVSDELLEPSASGGPPLRVQYFERGVLEVHPENAAPYTVLPARLGARAWPGGNG
jgi:acetyl esterase/lipase